DHPTEGRIRLLKNPVRFTHAPSAIDRLPANLGEHSVEVLTELGFSDGETAAMLRSGATTAPHTPDAVSH
ncbi:MAG: CoA transferase, partial [Actinomycetes bacterium]